MIVDTGLQRVSLQHRDQCCYVGAKVADVSTHHADRPQSA